jgi:cytochrome b561
MSHPIAVQTTRYSPSMQALHWLIAALMFAVLPLAWSMVGMPRTAPNRELLYMLHRSVGVTILALMAVRLVLRATRGVPAEPADLPRWMAGVAVASHWLLYAVLFIMPISGYVLSSSGGHAVPYFDLFILPALPEDKSMQELARSVHHVVQWAAYALIALHLLGTVWHVVVRRDSLLERELPPQIG